MNFTTLYFYSTLGAVILFSGTAVGQIQLPPIENEIRIEDDGIETVFPVNISISFSTVEDMLAVQAIINISFQNFQRNRTHILKNSLEKYDECGERLKLTSSNFFEQNEVAFLTISLRYERWMCAFGGKTRLARQSGTVKIKLTPEIDSSILSIRSQVIDVKANGALGSLLNNNSFKNEVIELIGLDDQFEAELPMEFLSLNPRFESFNFSTSQNVIFLTTRANMLLSGDELATLISLGNND